MREKRGLAVLRGLFAKAAGMASKPDGEEEDDDLETSLDEDFEELNAAVAASTQEEEEEDTEANLTEPIQDEDEMGVVGKANNLQPQDATPLIEALVATLQGIQEVQQRQLRQSGCSRPSGRLRIETTSSCPLVCGLRQVAAVLRGG